MDLSYKTGDLYLCKRYALIDIVSSISLESRWSHAGIIVMKDGIPHVLDMDYDRKPSLMRLIEYQRNPIIATSTIRRINLPQDPTSSYSFSQKLKASLDQMLLVLHEKNIDTALRAMTGKPSYDRTGYVSAEFISHYLHLCGKNVGNITIKDLEERGSSHIDRVYGREMPLGVLSSTSSQEIIRKVASDSNEIVLNLLASYILKNPRNQ